jgi:hypothetical protein
MYEARRSPLTHKCCCGIHFHAPERSAHEYAPAGIGRRRPSARGAGASSRPCGRPRKGPPSSPGGVRGSRPGSRRRRRAAASGGSSRPAGTRSAGCAAATRAACCPRPPRRPPAAGCSAGGSYPPHGLRAAPPPRECPPAGCAASGRRSAPTLIGPQGPARTRADGGRKVVGRRGGVSSSSTLGLWGRRQPKDPAGMDTNCMQQGPAIHDGPGLASPLAARGPCARRGRPGPGGP